MLTSVRATIVLVASLAYLAHIFQVFHERFWTSGMGDWMDPYFINALLEHWHHSLWTLSDPASPPMYFPARQTLGYSHGLVLYTPFYLPLRLFLHPFHAYTVALFAVLETGILCLYVLFRRFLNLSFVEALLMTAFFCTSQNVAGQATGVWSQRASVFLIPPILLIFLASRRRRGSRPGVLLAWLSGFLATLLFTQDFYTAQLGLLFVLLAVTIVLIESRRRIAEGIGAFWNSAFRGERLAVGGAVLLAIWSLYVVVSGGVAVRVLGIAIRSHDWRRPAVLALVCGAAFLWLRGAARVKSDLRVPSPWLLALGTGAVMGGAIFLWIHLAAYTEHRGFPEEHLWNALAHRDPARVSNPLAFAKDLSAYDTARAFVLVFTVAILAWCPWFPIRTSTRLYSLGFLLVSVLVLLMPVRFNDFSIWRTLLEPLPGFGVIRDPKRIIHLYELSTVIAIGALLTTVPRPSLFRLLIGVVTFALLVIAPNRQVFEYARPIDVYDRWVAAPIEIDRSCRAFFITPASEEYSARSEHRWTLYSIDALFVSLRHSVPTLNGYSAWSPEGWGLFDPEEAVYAERARQWVDRHALNNVCELDVDARTMKPVTLRTAR
jgi:hypothetical protein